MNIQNLETEIEKLINSKLKNAFQTKEVVKIKLHSYEAHADDVVMSQPINRQYHELRQLDMYYFIIADLNNGEKIFQTRASGAELEQYHNYNQYTSTDWTYTGGSYTTMDRTDYKTNNQNYNYHHQLNSGYRDPSFLFCKDLYDQIITYLNSEKTQFNRKLKLI